MFSEGEQFPLSIFSYTVIEVILKLCVFGEAEQHLPYLL